MLNEFYRVAFRKKIYTRLEDIHADLDAWFHEYNEVRPHQGRWCYGKPPMQTFQDSVAVAKEKVSRRDGRRHQPVRGSLTVRSKLGLYT